MLHYTCDSPHPGRPVPMTEAHTQNKWDAEGLLRTCRLNVHYPVVKEILLPILETLFHKDNACSPHWRQKVMTLNETFIKRYQNFLVSSINK